MDKENILIQGRLYVTETRINIIEAKNLKLVIYFLDNFLLYMTQCSYLNEIYFSIKRRYGTVAIPFWCSLYFKYCMKKLHFIYILKEKLYSMNLQRGCQTNSQVSIFKSETLILNLYHTHYYYYLYIKKVKIGVILTLGYLNILY